MRAFGKRTNNAEEQRRTGRRAVKLVGSAMSLEGSHSVLIEDFSSSGAKLLGRFLPRAGKEIVVRTDELWLFARVAWARDDYRGVAFEDS